MRLPVPVGGLASFIRSDVERNVMTQLTKPATIIHDVKLAGETYVVYVYRRHKITPDSTVHNMSEVGLTFNDLMFADTVLGLYKMVPASLLKDRHGTDHIGLWSQLDPNVRMLILHTIYE
jgi:hypothetical protein